MNLYRHGDVDLHQVSEVPVTVKPVNHNGSHILAYGEHTGHKHVLTVEKKEDMEIYESEEGTIINLKAAATLTHEEHAKITIQPGIYKQKQEREYNYFERSTRSVID